MIAWKLDFQASEIKSVAVTRMCNGMHISDQEAVAEHENAFHFIVFFHDMKPVTS